MQDNKQDHSQFKKYQFPQQNELVVESFLRYTQPPYFGRQI